MLAKTPTLAGNDGKQFTITLDTFNKGTMTLFNAARLPKEGVLQSQNMYLDEDGVWTTRPGTVPYGATLVGPTDGGTSFTKYNTDGTMNTYIGVVDAGAFKVSTDGGAWSTISGNTWTSGNPITMQQIKNRIYIANGVENLSYYDILAGTLHTYTGLTTPGVPTATAHGATGSTFTFYYRITAINEIGESIAGAEGSTTLTKKRDDWILGTDYIDLTWSAVSGATRYNIYYSDASGQGVYLDSVTTTSYTDYGTAIPNIYQAYPTANSSAGPKYRQYALASNQLWATDDPTTRYRVGWTGTGQFLGAFDPFSGGGYLDLEAGGNEVPTAIAAFRSGKGDSVATVLTSDPNGDGSIWAVTLATLTVDTLQITVPSYAKQQGIGTRSPRGIAHYNNTLFFPSPKGFQSLGSQQSILNVLVTNDISADIRPNVLGITNSAIGKICSIASNGRIYWSVPYGSSENNQIWVFDLERKGVWALPWTIGVSQFLEYTDSNGDIHLLAIPVSGTSLIEFDRNATSDSGVAFETNLKSGFIYFAGDHTSYAYIQKVYIELAQPVGKVRFTVSGLRKGKSFATLGTKDISSLGSESGNGYDADLYDDVAYDSSTYTPVAAGEASVIKKITINKMLNYMQWQLVSDDINTRYTVLQVIVKGVLLPTSDPSSYK